MDWGLAILLAAFQGVAEFLPISSSGHLRVLEEMSGTRPDVLFDLMLHLGTLAAVVIVYRAILGRLLAATGRALRRPGHLREQWRLEPDLRVVAWTLVACVPTGVLAILFEKRVDAVMTPAFVGVDLIVTGLLLLSIRYFQARRETSGRAIEDLRLRDALVVGTFQGISAVFRGVSRSGSTISSGLASGLRQDAAATFSFVLSIPAVLGAFLVKLKSASESGFHNVPWAQGIVGAAVAAIVGYFALTWLIRVLQKGRLHLFAIYCFCAGVAVIVWSLVRTVPAA